MSNFFLLTKIQFYSLFGINKALHSRDLKEKSKLKRQIALFAFVAVVFVGLSVIYNLAFAWALQELGGSFKLLPGGMLAVASMITLMTSIYKTNGTVFGFKDYDMIMSLPLKKWHIIASKVAFVYIISFLTFAVVMVPAGVIYGIFAGAGFLYYLMFVIVLPFAPLIPLVVGLFLGALITYATSRFKKSNIFSIILYVVFIVGIVVLGQINPSNTQYTDLLSGMNKVYPLTGMYVKATCDANVWQLLILVLISVAAAAAFFAVMGLNYVKINTLIMTKKSGGKYKSSDIRHSSPLKAVYKREMSRFFSISMYVINSGVGGIMAVLLGAVALIAKNSETFVALRELFGVFPNVVFLLPIALSFIVNLTATTTCTVSLEGKNLWIMKSSPVRTRDILLGKMLVNYVVLIPMGILGSVLLGLALDIGIGYHIYSIVVFTLLTAFTSALGLVTNLKFVKLDWTSEIVAIKQSASVGLFMLFDFVMALILGVGAYFLTAALSGLGAMIVLVIVLLFVIGINYMLFTWGVRAFERLDC